MARKNSKTYVTQEQIGIINQGLLKLAEETVKTERERYTVRVEIRLTPSQWEVLKGRIGQAKVSDWGRKALMDAPLPRPSRPVVPQINRQAFIDLKRIGNNINQQARAINESVKIGLAPPLSQIYLQELYELRDLIRQLRDEIFPKSEDTEEGQL